MLIKKITMVVLILIFLNGPSLLADVAFDCITVDEGLSQSSVSAIAQDSVGFMWFGTRDGLNRYDGNRIKVYRQNDEHHGSLADNWITSLFTDGAGTLWIGGLSGAVMHFESAADSFCVHPLPFQSEVMVLPNERMATLQVLFPYFHEKSVTAITGDGADGIWVATLSSGLFHISKKTGLAKVIPFPGNQPPIILRMVMLDYPVSNTLWIGTYGRGLWQMNLDSATSPRQHLVEPNTEFLSLLPDNVDSTALWAGTSTGVVLKMCLEKAVCQRIELKKTDGGSGNGNPVLSLLKSADGQLWIGTHGNGLYSYSERYGTVVWYPSQHQLKNALTISEVYTLCQDRAQNIWIGGRNGLGVHKIARSRKKFVHYSHRPGLPNSLSGNVIFGIAQDHEERLWIASAQSGLNCLDRKKNQITHYSVSAAIGRRLSSDQLRCVSVTKKNDVWVGSSNGGVCRFIDGKLPFICYRKGDHGLKSDDIRCFLEDETGDLWLGTFGCGIARYSYQTDTFTHFLEDSTAAVNLSRYRINAIQQDKNGHIWIAVYGLGCVIFDPVSEQLVRVLVKDEHLPEDRILSITFDSIFPEWVWLSTASGLIRYTMQSGVIRHYTVKDGLPNNMVYGALPDETGILWLSTNKGLSRFDPAMETFANYDANDGLQSNEFNWGAHYRSENGEMFFGGINGMNAFFPDQLGTDTSAPPIVITSITVFDVELPGIHPPHYKPVKLSYRDNFFSIEFAALDFTNPAKNQYAYQLDGLDTRWNRNGARNYVSYTNLPPGNYTFRVIGCNADGVWNHTGVAIPIIIIPPFYKTPLFYLIVAALLLFSGFLLYRWRLQQHVKRSVEIERIREKARERVRQAVATDFHDELGQDMTRISLFCEIVKRNLTDIEPEILTYIEKISQAAHHLSSTTRDFIWTLDPEFDSLYEFAIHLRDYGEDFFDGTGIAFYMASFDEAWHQLSLPMKWRRHLTLIFKEAMNNALKHANCDSVTMSLYIQERKISIALADNGRGPKNNGLATGNGFGLKNMQRRASSIEGKLTISNTESGGWQILFVGNIP